jgi:hypothetical protein
MVSPPEVCLRRMRVPSEGRKKLNSLRKTFVHKYFSWLFAPGVGV